MIDTCPVCSRERNSEEDDIGWYYVCCGLCGYRVVWVEEPELHLEVVDEPSDA